MVTEEPKKMYPDRDRAAILAMKTSKTERSLSDLTTPEREGTTVKACTCTCHVKAGVKLSLWARDCLRQECNTLLCIA